MAVLGTAAATAAPLAMDEHVFRVAVGIIGTVAYGRIYASEAFARKYEQFQHVLEEAMDMSASFSAEDFFPNAAGRLVDRLTGIIARRERIFRDLDAFFEVVLEQHLDPARPKPESGDGDLVDAFVRAWEEHGFTRDHTKAMLLDAFLGGVEGSSITILWAMSELVRNPSALKKAQGEIRAAVTARDVSPPGLPVQPDDLPKLTYLKMVVKETIRLHPPAPLLLPRETLRLDAAGGDGGGGHEHGGGRQANLPPQDVAGARAHALPPQLVWSSTQTPGKSYKISTWERCSSGWGGGIPLSIEEHPTKMDCDERRSASWRTARTVAMGVATVEFMLAYRLCSFDWTLLGEGAEDISKEEAKKLTFHCKTPLVLVPMLYIRT
ncbi:unnamed protein product [Triticum turgidum subsp. durum]|uniref:4-hydroxyphenylacetaldehyde oxime monooxygenase n=1 Tax=Triticum turgidum subsp. durum TaxID=4567 RepID=A0A9R0SMI9_TRITD|nr:unnamed protein product [Triticum turgidum subsp. durum]